jgi:hypothetical protein
MYVTQDQGRDFAKNLGVRFQHVAKEKYGFSERKIPIGFGQYTKKMIAKSPQLFKEVLGSVVADMLEDAEKEQVEGVREIVMELERFEVGKKVGSLEVGEERIEEGAQESWENRMLVAA